MLLDYEPYVVSALMRSVQRQRSETPEFHKKIAKPPFGIVPNLFVHPFLPSSILTNLLKVIR